MSEEKATEEKETGKKEEGTKEEEILVDVEDTSTSEKPESDKEKTGEETEEIPEETSGKTKEEIPTMFQGKKPAELVKIIQDKERFIGQRSKEIGDLKAKLTPEKPQTSKGIKKNMNSLKGKLNNIDNRISKLDPDLDDEYSTLSIRKKELTKELENSKESYQDVFMREIVREETAGESNVELAKDVRKDYEDNYKLMFNDEEWKAITGTVNNISLDVKQTKSDYESALIHTLGIDKYRKIMIGQAEANTRDKIAKAKEREAPAIEGGKSTSTGSLDLLSLPKKELNKLVDKHAKILDKLTPKQLDKLYDKINKK